MADPNDMQAEQIAELTDTLQRHGFVRCDITACNCGSWHPRYGLQERMDELKALVADAGHPLSNGNGNLLRNAVSELIWDRDALRRDCLTMALRLCGENPDSFAPETAEVMDRWRIITEALLLSPDYVQK